MKSLVTPFLILFSSFVFANARLDGISGVSRFVINPQDGSFTVFGGIQGANSSTFSCANNTTCNTCNGSVLDGACNPSGVFANTILSFTGTPTGTIAPTAVWLLCNGGQEVFRSANIQTPLAFTWGDLCSSIPAGGTSGNNDCSTPLSTTTFLFGNGADCNNLGQQRVSIRFLARDVNTAVASNYTDCPTVGTGGFGACHFSLFPGDGKAFLVSENFVVDNSFPTVDGGPTGITFENIYFFFVEKLAGEPDGDAFNRITNNTVDGTANVSNTSTIPVANSDELGGSFIDGIDNEVRYCFKMASQDSAGNIEYFTPASVCPLTTPTCDDVCVTPSEVIGILTDKKCFIATAAFGSEMNEKVQMLREFRNEFLASHWFGRKAVKLYYQISPPLASWVSQHEWARSLARGLLWPFVFWAELSLKLGWFIFLLPFMAMGSAALIFRRKWRSA